MRTRFNPAMLEASQFIGDGAKVRAILNGEIYIYFSGRGPASFSGVASLFGHF